MFVALAIAGERAAPPPGIEEVVVQGDTFGGRRSAWVHAPTGSEGPLPVVLAFHGGHGNDGSTMGPRFRDKFDAPALLVFPNGDPDNPGEIGWVGPGVPGVTDPAQDVKFVAALLDELGRRFPIDRSRVYAVGFSNGGYFTHTLFCTADAAFAGFAMVARPIARDLAQSCRGAAKPVMLMVGTADPKAVNDHDLPREETVAFYAGKLGCKDKTPPRVTLADQGAPELVYRTEWTRCDDGAALVSYEIVGGGHTWPKTSGPAATDVDATAEIWRFFGLP